MKTRTLIFILTLSLMLPLYGLTASAEAAPETTVTDPAAQTVTRFGGQFGRRWNPATAQGAAGSYFVDENNDGICDNCGLEHPLAGQGLNTACENFVDADNDGVCDNFGTAAQGAGRGRQGRGRGMKASGNGAGFVDADNNGVCDNFGSASQGGRHGRHR